MRFLREILLVAFVFVLGYFFGIQEVRFYKITSSSMEPTLTVGDRIAATRPRDLERFQIVVLKDPAGSSDILTKRIIGLPGEMIAVKNGSVYINNERLSEPDTREKPGYGVKKTRIPAGYYFILGDNRNNSEDSSVWGPVRGELIIGKAVCRYWPLRKFGLFLSNK